MKTLIIIPARGGSKGIPRKNLRPVAGKPMIFWTIQACINAKGVSKIVVSTDDEEIALIASRFGAEVFHRPVELADDKTTLDEVICNEVPRIEKEAKDIYDVILTVQPTSPLLLPSDIESVLEIFYSSDIDTVLSVVDDRHLNWTIENNRPIPLYTKRVNRQLLPPNFRETGAVIGCRRGQISVGTRIGNKVQFYEMPKNRAYDIDSFEDLILCDALLSKRVILFTVVGYDEVGLGHAFRAVMLANELVQYEIKFLCEKKSNLAAEFIKSKNYSVEICDDGKMLETILAIRPNMVINDILDTDEQYINSIKSSGIIVVNFEDIGSGCHVADLTVNALYPYKFPSKHILTGSEYFCLRDEFLFLNRPDRIGKQINCILITFGGVDEGNLTLRTLKIIENLVAEESIKVTVVLGPGYPHKSELYSFTNNYLAEIEIIEKTNRISEYMVKADMAITSGGRTVLELASVYMPTVVICQNKRETTHTFASSDHGVINLGFREEVEDRDIFDTVKLVIEDEELRNTMIEKAMSVDLTGGKSRVINQIIQLFRS